MMVTEISNAVKMMSLTRSQIMESSWRFNFMQKITGIGKHSLLSIFFLNDFLMTLGVILGCSRSVFFESIFMFCTKWDAEHRLD